MFEWFDVLVGQFGEVVGVVIAVLYGGYKFHRVKTIIGGMVAAIGTAATFGALVVAALVVGSVTGWVSVDLGQAINDLSSGAGTAWDTVGQPAIDWLTSEVMG